MKAVSTLAALAAGVLMSIAGQANAASYEYHFTGNPDARGSSTSIDPTLDVALTFGFTDAALAAGSINNVGSWQSGDIWLKATYQGQTVNLGAGVIASEHPDDYLSFAAIPNDYDTDGGALWLRSNAFLSFDLHGENTLVVQYDLPFDPFVGGRVSAYADQADHLAAKAVWLNGDRSSLAAHAVPEPSTWALAATGLAIGGIAVRRRQRKSA